MYMYHAYPYHKAAVDCTFSEGELEEVLTTYTKLNRSASIFLGGNSKASSEKPVAPPNPPEPTLHKRREQSEESLDTRTADDTAAYRKYGVNGTHTHTYSVELRCLRLT